MKNKHLFIFYLVMGIFLLSCNGSEGPTGPQGETGPQGPAGPQGAQGEDGNANVTIVELLKEDITWTDSNYLGRPANVFILDDNNVNQDILDSGAVLGFLYLSGNWYPMPFTWENSAGSNTQYITFSYALNQINLFAYSTNGPLDPGAVTEYRFMLITDNTVGKTGVKSDEKSSVLDNLKKSGLDTSDYYAVCAYFGINPN